MVHLSIRAMVGMEGKALEVEVVDVDEVVHFVEEDAVMVTNQVDILIMVILWHHQYLVSILLVSLLLLVIKVCKL